MSPRLEPLDSELCCQHMRHYTMPPFVHLEALERREFLSSQAIFYHTYLLPQSGLEIEKKSAMPCIVSYTLNYILADAGDFIQGGHELTGNSSGVGGIHI